MASVAQTERGGEKVVQVTWEAGEKSNRRAVRGPARFPVGGGQHLHWREACSDAAPRGTGYSPQCASHTVGLCTSGACVDMGTGGCVGGVCGSDTVFI